MVTGTFLFQLPFIPFIYFIYSSSKHGKSAQTSEDSEDGRPLISVPQAALVRHADVAKANADTPPHMRE